MSVVKFKLGQRFVLNTRGVIKNHDLREVDTTVYPAHIRLTEKDYDVGTWYCYNFNGNEVQVHEEDLRLYYDYE